MSSSLLVALPFFVLFCLGFRLGSASVSIREIILIHIARRGASLVHCFVLRRQCNQGM